MQRRSQPRRPGDSTIELFAEDGSLLARGALLNVSEHGLGVARLERVASRELAKGERLSVRFVVPTGEVATEARVQWVNGGQRELGLKISPEGPSAAVLARYLDGAPPD
jgi:hypothetical protein